MSKYTTQQIANLTAAEVSRLSIKDIAELSVDNIAAFGSNAAGLSALHLDALAKRDGYTFGRLSGQAITSLTNDTIGSLTDETIRALQFYQIKYLTVKQIAALSPRQISLLDFLQIGAFSTDQITALSPLQVASISTTPVVLISPEASAGLNEEQRALLDPKFFTPTAAIEGLTMTLLSSFSLEATLALTAKQLGMIRADKLAALRIFSANPNQVKAQMEVLNAEFRYQFVHSYASTYIAGKSGADYLSASKSSATNVFDGGLGNDFFMGGEGSDSYLFDLKTYFGRDQIFDQGSAGNDSIRLAGSLIGTRDDENKYNLLFNRIGNDLLITDLENNRSTGYAPTIRVSNHFLDRNKIETVSILMHNGGYTSISAAGIDVLVQAMAGINYSTATSASLSSDPITAAINANWKVGL